jgi:hypothetical protein
MELSHRLKNIMYFENIKSPEDFVKMGWKNVLRVPNCGKNTLREIRDYVQYNGYEFEDQKGLENYLLKKMQVKHKKEGRIWTIKRLEEAARNVRNGMPYRVAAAKHNSCKDSLKDAMKRYGITVSKKEETETLRDKFAMAALTGLLANPNLQEHILKTGGAMGGWIEESAWSWADGMMEARK